jgi:hypothetical protein
METVLFEVRAVFFYLILINDVFKFLAMAVAVSRRTLIMKARVRSRISPSGICGVVQYHWARFLRSILVFL